MTLYWCIFMRHMLMMLHGGYLIYASVCQWRFIATSYYAALLHFIDASVCVISKWRFIDTSYECISYECNSFMCHPFDNSKIIWTCRVCCLRFNFLECMCIGGGGRGCHKAPTLLCAQWGNTINCAIESTKFGVCSMQWWLLAAVMKWCNGVMVMKCCSGCESNWNGFKG